MFSSGSKARSGSSSGTSGGGSGASPPKPVLVEKPGPTNLDKLDGTGMHIAIVYTHWYEHIVTPLVDACANELQAKGVDNNNIKRIQVPGAFELPFAANRVIQVKGDQQIDAIVCIGCMINGGTMSYQFVTEAVTMAFMKLNVKTHVPVINGLLACNDEAEAKRCAGVDTASSSSSSSTSSSMPTAGMAALGIGSHHGSSRGGHGASKQCNHGVEWAQSALEMAHCKRKSLTKMSHSCGCSCHCAKTSEGSCQCACHCDKCKCGDKKCTCPKGTCSCNCQKKCGTCGKDRSSCTCPSDASKQVTTEGMQLAGDSTSKHPTTTSGGGGGGGADTSSKQCQGCNKSKDQCTCKESDKLAAKVASMTK